MSQQLYNIGSLRLWEEHEIERREYFIKSISLLVKEKLLNQNKNWIFHRVEGTILTPVNEISTEYDEKDIFLTGVKKNNVNLALRAETTKTSYLYAQKLNAKKPLCVWQSGKSFRVESNDGASWSKLRANEFYQLEFQCIYSKSSLCDYKLTVIDELALLLKHLTYSQEVRIVPSDRLPSYSNSTDDIEVFFRGKHKEVCSVSIRNDYSDDCLVLEIAVGLDRLLEIYNHNTREVKNEK